MKALLLTILLIFTTDAECVEPQVFDGLWKNTKDSFIEDNSELHLIGAALTPLIITTGLDATVHDNFDDEPRQGLYRPGEVLGYMAPFLLAGPLYFHGKFSEDHESLRASYAVIQTTIISLTYISILKGLTGRPPPNNNKPENIRDQSEEFNFGIFERGIVWGWPSGHMATTMALASTLTHYYPESNWIKGAAYGTAAYMFLVVSANDRGQMHWFSDGVAGALMGYAIGTAVGSNFREAQNNVETSKNISMVLPIMTPEKRGIQMMWWY
jgi:hypothetical protein